MKLFLDDIRKPTDVKVAYHNGAYEEFPSLFSWEIVRSYEEFVGFIKKNGLPTVISFDHDLSWEHYPKEGPIVEGDWRTGKIKLPYDSYKEKTGYHAAQWLVEYCLERGLDLPESYVHSFNPVGRQNIIDYLNQFGRMQEVYAKAKPLDSSDSKIIIP